MGIFNSTREGYDSPEYKAWRNAVFVRDKFTCQLTGRTGCPLEAHHIIPWAKAPSLRYVVSNGITLSKDAHGTVTGNEEKFEDQFKKIVAFKKKEQEKLYGKKPSKSFQKGKWRPLNPRVRF